MSLTVQTDKNFIQQTDLYPDIAKGLWKIILKEKIHVMISILPYLPTEYTSRAQERIPGKLEIFSIFNQGPISTLLNFTRTNYYYILKAQCQVSFLTLCIYVIKFYRYSLYIKRSGYDLLDFFQDHQNFDPSNHLGTITNCAVKKILPAEEFIAFDKEILALFEKNIFRIVLGLRKTNYFHMQRTKRKMTLKQTLKWVNKYYRLYASMKKNGYKVNNNSLNSFSWLFVSKKITMRLDGHHRSAVATHLKIKEIPVLLVTPEDLATHGDINNDFLQSLL